MTRLKVERRTALGLVLCTALAAPAAYMRQTKPAGGPPPSSDALSVPGLEDAVALLDVEVDRLAVLMSSVNAGTSRPVEPFVGSVPAPTAPKAAVRVSEAAPPPDRSRPPEIAPPPLVAILTTTIDGRTDRRAAVGVGAGVTVVRIGQSVWGFVLDDIRDETVRWKTPDGRHITATVD